MNKERQIPTAERQDWDKRKEGGGYSDKGGHKERSNANQPTHQEHWKKEEKKK
jgi:hypothetical protein